MNFKKIIFKLLDKSLSLNFIVLIPFLVQITGVVTITGYLSFKNGEKAVKDLSFQLLSEVSYRVEEKIEYYTSSAALINKLNAELIEINELDPDSKDRILKHFYKQIKHFPYIAFIFYGNSLGEFYGVRRLNENKYNIIIADRATNYKLEYYRDFEKYQQNIVAFLYKKYDSRKRPWYKSATKKQKQTWSNIYTAFRDQIRAITNSYPIYDQKKKNKRCFGSRYILRSFLRFS